MGINLMADLGFDENAEDVKKARSAARMYSGVIDALVACRNRLGFTQTQVAKLMGTTQSAISEFESVNSDARFSTLIRYAQAVDCDMVIELEPHSPFAWVEVQMTKAGHVIPFAAKRYTHNQARVESVSPSAVFEMEAVAR
jgi:transcriptional regulator with XRE-family HTH domain